MRQRKAGVTLRERWRGIDRVSAAGEDGWPLMGDDIDKDGIGEPVMEWAKPDNSRSFPVSNPQTTDEFDAKKLSLQWQWHANPRKD